MHANVVDRPLLRAHVHQTGLAFPVDTYFAIGSPLGMFLTLRECHITRVKLRPHDVFPAVRQMFNVFHPCDVIAYRLEPLIARYRALSAEPEAAKFLVAH